MICCCEQKKKEEQEEVKIVGKIYEGCDEGGRNTKPKPKKKRFHWVGVPNMPFLITSPAVTVGWLDCVD